MFSRCHRALFCWGILGPLVLVPSLHAEGVLYRARVKDPEVQVRCGPGEDARLYATNRLRQGDVVEVLRELPDGWLGIRPPAGSFSWINTRFVERVVASQPSWAVTVHPDVRVPVLIGSELRGGRPTVEGVRLRRGAQVRSIGATQDDEEGSWLPIEAPPGEMRYVRAAAVVKLSPGESVPPPASSVAVKPVPSPALAIPGQAAAPATPAARPAAARQASSSPVRLLWEQAVQAEKAGRYAEAVQLYTRVGAEGTQTDNELAMHALNRAYWLRSSLLQQQAHGVRPVQPSRAAQATLASRPADQGGPHGTYRVPGSPGQPGQGAAPTVRLAAPCDVPGQAAPAAQGSSWSSRLRAEATRQYSSGPGRLRRAGRMLDGQRTYVLESTQGYPRLYVTPQPGLDLEPHVDRMVELIGPSIYRGDLRANYMVAEQARPAQ